MKQAAQVSKGTGCTRCIWRSLEMPAHCTSMCKHHQTSTTCSFANICHTFVFYRTLLHRARFKLLARLACILSDCSFPGMRTSALETASICFPSTSLVFVLESSTILHIRQECSFANAACSCEGLCGSRIHLFQSKRNVSRIQAKIGVSRTLLLFSAICSCKPRA